MKQLKMKQRNRGGFHSISLGTLAASVLRNLLYGKDVAAKGLRQKTIKLVMELSQERTGL